MRSSEAWRISDFEPPRDGRARRVFGICTDGFWMMASKAQTNSETQETREEAADGPLMDG